jgi:DNA invertase Pin-like site-specific DNA recombinase
MDKYITYVRCSTENQLNPSDNLRQQMMSLMAHHYRQEMSKRIKAGIAKKRELAISKRES